MQKLSTQEILSEDSGTNGSRLRQNVSTHRSDGTVTNAVIEQTFQKYNEALVRYLSVRLHSIADAEEVAQEAYVRMLKLDEPDTISHLQAYLFKIASNIAVDRMRKHGRRPQHLSLDGVSAGVPAPASQVDRIVNAQQQLMLITEIVKELPPKCRKAFLLYKFRCRSYAEIAETMNLTESMIRKYVLRAVAYCRVRLDDRQVNG